MLYDDFYRVTDLKTEEGNVNAQIHFNPAHRIFDGHFPGQPVVPGVCMLEMVKEILSLVTGKQLHLHKSDNLKFLTVIDPRNHPSVNINIRYKQTEAGLSADAQLSYEQVFFFKCKGDFSSEPAALAQPKAISH